MRIELEQGSEFSFALSKQGTWRAKDAKLETDFIGRR